MRQKAIVVALSMILLAGCGHPKQDKVNAVEERSPIPVPAMASPAPPTDMNMKETVRTSEEAVHAGYNIKQHVTYSGSRREKKVALTFDDGPDAKYTEQILEILKKENVPATFFVTGEHASAHPEVMKRIVNGGHEIGNHSWDHADLTKVDEKQLTDEIDKTDEVIKNYTGRLPTYVRPPYGAISKPVVDYVEKSHKVICWSVDTRDWEGIPAERILDNVKREVKPGAIILQHSAGGKKGNLSNTVKALPQIIHYLREQGYEFGTISDLTSVNG